MVNMTYKNAYVGRPNIKVWTLKGKTYETIQAMAKDNDIGEKSMQRYAKKGRDKAGNIIRAITKVQK